MIFFILCEEESMEKVLDIILPKILPADAGYRILPHQGKGDLKKALEKTLPSLCKVPGARIIVTCDQDMEDCAGLKKKLLKMIPESCKASLLVRIVCRELECWFFGDLNAVGKAFPRFKAKSFVNKSKFRNVDNIQNPDKKLCEIIPEYSNRESLPKIETARRIAPYLDIEQNRSTSFRHFISGVERLMMDS